MAILHYHRYGHLIIVNASFPGDFLMMDFQLFGHTRKLATEKVGCKLLVNSVILNYRRVSKQLHQHVWLLLTQLLHNAIYNMI